MRSCYHWNLGTISHFSWGHYVKSTGLSKWEEEWFFEKVQLIWIRHSWASNLVVFYRGNRFSQFWWGEMCWWSAEIKRDVFFLLNFFFRYHVAPERDTVSWTWDQPHGFLTCFIYTACHWSTQVIVLCCDGNTYEVRTNRTKMTDWRNMRWKGWTRVPAATQTYRGGKGWPNAFRLER